MIGFEGVLIAAGTLLILGPSLGAPAEHHGYMLGAASGILFGVSDVAIKAISGMVGSAGVAGLLTPVVARRASPPRSPRSTPRLRASRTATRCR